MKALALVIGSGCMLLGGFLLRADDRKVDPEKILPPGTAKMDFVEDIGPIFERSCIRCHNSDRRGQFGAFRVGFRLDLGRDVAMEDEGIIVPGKSEKSRLIRHVVRLDTPMPPP